MNRNKTKIFINLINKYLKEKNHVFGVQNLTKELFRPQQKKILENLGKNLKHFSSFRLQLKHFSSPDSNSHCLAREFVLNTKKKRVKLLNQIKNGTGKIHCER